MENDTITGGEELSLDQAAAAYVKSQSAPEVQKDQPVGEEPDESLPTDDELQASDEEAGEEDEGEPGDEDQAEGEDEDPESEQGRFVADNAKVRLEDGTVVSVSELKKGSLLNADYTRKTQEVAELRRSTEAQSASVKQAEQQINERAEYMANLLKAIVPPAPDVALLKTDPMAYIEQEAAHKQWVQHLQYLDEQKQLGATQSQAEAQIKDKEDADRAYAALLEAAPEFKDEKRLNAFVAEITKHGVETYGFKPEELRAVAKDHRQALVLRDAIAWRKLQTSKPQIAKKVDGRPPIHRGGKRQSPQAQRDRQATEAITRLKSSGSVDDAAAAYLASRKG